MSIDQIIAQLEARYPSKAIVRLPLDNPTEIICETEPTSSHPTWSKALAIITKSALHVHRQTTEEYRVLNGTLKLWIDNDLHILNEGDKITIHPNQTHRAEGDWTWVETISRPGLSKSDHVLV